MLSRKWPIVGLLACLCCVMSGEEIDVFVKPLPDGLGETYELIRIEKLEIYKGKTLEQAKGLLIRNEKKPVFHSCKVVLNKDGTPSGAVWIVIQSLALETVYEYKYSNDYLNRFSWGVIGARSQYYNTMDEAREGKNEFLLKSDIKELQIIKDYASTGSSSGKYLLRQIGRKDYKNTEKEQAEWSEHHKSLIKRLEKLTSLKAYEWRIDLKTLSSEDAFLPRFGMLLEGPRPRVHTGIRCNKSGFEDPLKRADVEIDIEDYSFCSTEIAKHEMFRSIVTSKREFELIENPFGGLLVRVKEKAPRDLGQIIFLNGKCVIKVTDNGYGIENFIKTIGIKSDVSSKDISYYRNWDMDEIAIFGNCIKKILNMNDEWVRDSHYLRPLKKLIYSSGDKGLTVKDFKDIDVSVRRKKLEDLLNKLGYKNPESK